jgi:ABC-type multidrug transport system ATPase subunit
MVGLIVDNVSKSFGSTQVLDGVQATFPANSVSFLMGSNGAGKTTLARCILGLERYEGRISWNGAPVDPSARHLCPVFDDAPFHARLTGRQNLQVLVPESLDGPVVYLSPAVMRRRVAAYSHGQRMRLALMAALNSGSELLVLDEPLNGLDRHTMLSLREDLRRIATTATVIVTGHHLEFYDGLVDHVFVLRDGAIHRVQRAHAGEGRSSLAGIFEQHCASAGQ